MAIVAATVVVKVMMMMLLLLMMMIGTFASTVAVGLATSHIVVAHGSSGDGGVEGIAGAASGPIADRRHNVQLPDRSRRLVIVDRANAADDRGRNLRFSITFCSYDCTVLLLLLLAVVLLLLLLAVTLIITTTDTVSPATE